jgi:hypothetical protein
VTERLISKLFSKRVLFRIKGVEGGRSLKVNTIHCAEQAS